eukprot:CAMPEP_0184870876 /NCGR_PEP_ID=MMETSP0580-20130426/39108_1 /TAXON_ID=1118495 /ORGANISM="Dactyliosolen fragilissimus" /LENGTH=507 /DNA_ID=CAMNT_0027373227 /DNA_START=59 /DNA_END=1582 /DNA_ORIENTATION=+
MSEEDDESLTRINEDLNVNDGDDRQEVNIPLSNNMNTLENFSFEEIKEETEEIDTEINNIGVASVFPTSTISEPEPMDENDQNSNNPASSRHGAFRVFPINTNPVETVNGFDELIDNDQIQVLAVEGTVVIPDADVVVTVNPTDCGLIDNNPGKATKFRNMMIKRSTCFVLVPILLITSAVVIVSVLFVSNNSETAEELDPARFKMFLDLVSPISGGKDIFDIRSPNVSYDRIEALKWLTRDNYDYSFHGTNMYWKIKQRYILALFYFSTKGAYWYKDVSFLTNRDECGWVAAWSENTFVPLEVQGALCNLEGKLEMISLNWNNISGTLPHEISFFNSTMKGLKLIGNSLSSTIPESYSNLKKLTELYLEENCLTGTVPKSFNELKYLANITLQGNINLSGSLNGFCNFENMTQKKVYITADCGTCAGSEVLIECDCCTCCESRSFQCCDQSGLFKYHYYSLTPNPGSTIPRSFERECASDEMRLWQQNECPCPTLTDTSYQCSKEC